MKVPGPGGEAFQGKTKNKKTKNKKTTENSLCPTDNNSVRNERKAARGGE